MPGGSSRWARAIIDCTSCAAASIERLRSNWMVMLVLPCELLELMELTPAIVENCFSSGVATDAAIVSGLAPGRFAVTWSVGKSTVGRSLTGRSRYPMAPKIRIDSTRRVVATGRRMNGSAIFMVLSSGDPTRAKPPGSVPRPGRRASGEDDRR